MASSSNISPTYIVISSNDQGILCGQYVGRFIFLRGWVTLSGQLAWYDLPLLMLASSWLQTVGLILLLPHARSFARVITACFSISAHLSTYLACPLWRESNLAETLGRETIVSPSGRPANFSLLAVSIDQVSRGMENTQHVLS